MLSFRLLLPVLANAIPAFAVEPKKSTTVITEDSYKNDVISTRRAVQEECTDDPPDWGVEYDYDYHGETRGCGDFSHWLKVGVDYNYVCINGFHANREDENGLTVKDACCACGAGITVDPEQETCISDPPDWTNDYDYDCDFFEAMVDDEYDYNYICKNEVEVACCFCGGGKTVDPEQESNWFITYVESLLSNNALTSTYNTKSGVGTDYITKFTDGTCASEGTPHDGSVFTTTHGTNDADDTLFITKTINAAAIANQHGGSFVFCEKVALTDTGVSQTYEVVYAKTQYTIAATFLADINSYSVTLQDDTSITEESEDLSLTGTVVVTRCGGVSENLNPGDELCLEISETSSTDIGVESINNLNFIQDVATFAAIKDGVNQHTNLVDEPDCADGACTVDITVPSFMYEGSSGSATVTMDVSGDVYLYDMSSKNGKAEINSFSLSVKLEKPCEGGLLESIAKMFSK